MKKILNSCSIFMAVIGSCSAVLVCFILLIYPNLNKNTTVAQTAVTNNIEDAVLPTITYQDNSSAADNTTYTDSTSDIIQSRESASLAIEPAASQDTNIPSEYKSALNKADAYSNTMYMSKAAIYNQLTSEYGENFSPEAAQYAIDNVTVDWNSNALQKAKDYSDTMYMSKAAIYDQIVSEYGEKFTPSEAQYAVDNLVADYNSNALQKARDYSDTMYMSKAAIYNQLVSEYGEKFTPSEAQYAVDNLVADYNSNALQKARDYQNTMDMSPSTIYDQLTSEYGEKFTSSEADYAIANLN